MEWSQYWTRIRTNNVIERLNREIRRRTRVVGTFPDGNSALMLVCARLRHVAGTQWGNKKYMNMKHLEAAYQASCTDCSHCGRRKTCFETNSTRRRVLASSCYPAFFRGHSRVGTSAYLSMMRLRKIWAEGSFSVLKREHCLSRIRKRGIPAVTEECLLSVMALNLKRMVKASFFSCFLRLSMCHVSRDLLWNDYFVNRSNS